MAMEMTRTTIVRDLAVIERSVGIQLHTNSKNFFRPKYRCVRRGDGRVRRELDVGIRGLDIPFFAIAEELTVQ